MFLRLIVLNGLFQLALATSNLPKNGLNQKLLVVSFDGFRQMYFQEHAQRLPWFREFSENGVISYNVRSVFPSDTFPNHWSIVTGMYSESHGIVNNYFYDPVLNEGFTMDTLDVKFWNNTDPIWSTARRQGKTTATWYWVGCAVQFPNDGTPTYSREYEDHPNYITDISDLVQHLSDDVDLAFMYFNQPDKIGHSDGPESEGTSEMLEKMDWYLSDLLLSLEKSNLGPDVLNVIVAADHGMHNITSVLWLEDYVDMDSIEMVPTYGPVVGIMPKPGRKDEIVANLTFAGQETGLFTAYRKEDIPDDVHYSKSSRIMEIVVFCELGTYLSKYKSTGLSATHGYTPSLNSMRPIFMARGPAFKQGYEVQGMFETKDIYAIIAHVVGINPLSTNATFDRVTEIFAPSSASTPKKATGGLLTTSILLTALSLYFW